eukprot:5452428-Pleurochrysis_carterae.AAC.2
MRCNKNVVRQNITCHETWPSNLVRCTDTAPHPYPPTALMTASRRHLADGRCPRHNAQGTRHKARNTRLLNCSQSGLTPPNSQQTPPNHRRRRHDVARCSTLNEGDQRGQEAVT